MRRGSGDGVCRRGASANATQETCARGFGETCAGGGQTCAGDFEAGRNARGQDGCAAIRFQQATGYSQHDA